MRRIRWITVMIGTVAMGIAAADALAYYHPGLGAFVSRDPGIGDAMRIGAGGPGVGSEFAARDPIHIIPYADGMNLHQYVGGNPIRLQDPAGLYGRETHLELTTRIAQASLGFQQWAAERLGEANMSVDGLIGPTGWFLVGLDWHFDIDTKGGSVPAVWDNTDSRFQRSRERMAEAVRLCTRAQGRERDAVWELGRGLHPVQDFYAHGNWRVWYFPSPFPLLHPGWYDGPEYDGSGPAKVPVAEPDNRRSSGTLGTERYNNMKWHSEAYYLREFTWRMKYKYAHNEDARQCLCRILRRDSFWWPTED